MKKNWIIEKQLISNKMRKQIKKYHPNLDFTHYPDSVGLLKFLLAQLPPFKAAQLSPASEKDQLT